MGLSSVHASVHRTDPRDVDGKLKVLDKEGYPDSVPVAKSRLRRGGILLVDNMLWRGRAFDASERSASTEGVGELTRIRHSDPDFLCSVVPIRDGLLVALKIRSKSAEVPEVRAMIRGVHAMLYRAAFIASMRLHDHEFTPVRLPFGKVWLPAYFMKPRGNTVRSKTILVLNGFDGTLEEDYFYAGRAALDRGYNVLHLAGPGQMDTVRFYPGLPFIPDFERVLEVAMDYILARPDVDPRRVGLVGFSMGGYFSTRGAVHEPRLRAVVPSSPIVDLHAYLIAAAGIDPSRLPDDEDFDVSDLPHLPLSPTGRAATESLLVRFGQPTFKKTFEHIRAFAVSDADLAQIKIPALAVVGAGEGNVPLEQFERFKAKVGGPVAGYVFTAEGGGDNHTQVGNLPLANAVIFDWLDETFR